MLWCDAVLDNNIILSQDMIAETVSQANHCFSISTNPEPNHSTILSGNNKVIILPEMANAVICPETGKSLKHQELITKLRYKKMDAIHSKRNQQAIQH
jgi:hypothetical protein